MNDTAQNHFRRNLALGVLALFFGLCLMSLAGGCARNGQVVTPPPPILRLASAPVVPPVPTVTYYWSNADGACITDVWMSTNLTQMQWAHLGRVTNTEQMTVAKVGSMQFFRSSHPQIVGHIYDTGAWRVNKKLLGIE